jgi:hypothetical protein
MQSKAPDSLNTRLWLALAVLGAVLAVVGWYRFFGG